MISSNSGVGSYCLIGTAVFLDEASSWLGCVGGSWLGRIGGSGLINLGIPYFLLLLPLILLLPILLLLATAPLLFLIII